MQSSSTVASGVPAGTSAAHLEILDACLARSPERAAELLAKHIQISREHTLGSKPMRWKGQVPTLTRRWCSNDVYRSGRTPA